MAGALTIPALFTLSDQFLSKTESKPHLNGLTPRLRPSTGQVWPLSVFVCRLQTHEVLFSFYHLSSLATMVVSNGLLRTNARSIYDELDDQLLFTGAAASSHATSVFRFGAGA